MIKARVQVDPTAQRQLHAALQQGLTRAVVFLWERIQESLNVPNTGVRRKAKRRKTKSGKPATYTVYPSPSKPGEPPRKRTGWGQRHVLYSIDRGEPSARVGVAQNAAYMAHLETGTARVKARPWLVAAVVKHALALADLVRGAAPGGGPHG